MPDIQPSSAAYFFGEFRLRLDGSEVTSWHAGKSRALFQFLYANHGRSVSRDRLRETLWPQLAPSCGQASVKAAVYGARRTLRQCGTSATVAIESVGQGYRLRCADLWSDTSAFTSNMAMAAAATRANDRVAAAANYRAALDLYHGPFLATEDAPWVVDHREYFRSQAMGAVRQLWQEAVDAGDDWSALTWSHRALELDPDDQSAYDLLVAANHRLGLTAQASRWDTLAQVRFADA